MCLYQKMNAPVEMFLCLRYLKPKRTFVSIITVISVLGVAIGVMVLIVVLSVMNGLGRDLRNIILSMDAHIIVTNREVMTDWQGVVAAAGKTPHVLGAAPFVRGPVMLEIGNQVDTPVLKGIDPALEPKVSRINEYVREGKFVLKGDSVLVGTEMAREHGIFVGDKITVAGPRVLKVVQKQNEAYLPVELTVTGIFDSGMYDYDRYVIFTSLPTAQEVYDLGQGIHGVGVITDNPFQSPRIAEDLNRRLKAPNHAYTWIEQNQTLFSALEVEKNVMFFIMIMISVVAGFCIMNTLITVVVQKTHEIGLLKALGGTNRQVLLVFLMQGFIVGVTGVAAGVITGLLALQFRNELLHVLRNTTGIEIFPAKLYHFSELPSQIIVSDIVQISIVALIICTLAGLLPAWRAARLEPVEALRYE